MISVNQQDPTGILRGFSISKNLAPLFYQVVLIVSPIPGSCSRTEWSNSRVALLAVENPRGVP